MVEIVSERVSRHRQSIKCRDIEEAADSFSVRIFSCHLLRVSGKVDYIIK